MDLARPPVLPPICKAGTWDGWTDGRTDGTNKPIYFPTYLPSPPCFFFSSIVDVEVVAGWRARTTDVRLSTYPPIYLAAASPLTPCSVSSTLLVYTFSAAYTPIHPSISRMSYLPASVCLYTSAARTSLSSRLSDARRLEDERTDGRTDQQMPTQSSLPNGRKKREERQTSGVHLSLLSVARQQGGGTASRHLHVTIPNPPLYAFTHAYIPYIHYTCVASPSVRQSVSQSGEGRDEGRKDGRTGGRADGRTNGIFKSFTTIVKIIVISTRSLRVHDGVST
ncbi:hypothetical protein IWX91DRAFT_28573 [Phyllosticta citricarpa]